MELLICIVDRTSTDPILDLQLVKAGDVICHHADGQDWGLEEINNPDWRIVHVPEMTEEMALAFAAPDVALPGQPTRMRQIALDLHKLNSHDESLLKPRKVRAHARGNNIDATIPQAALLGAHSLKARLELPTHIGDDGNVIG